jgi:mannose-1-phosphate guanylyltransferase
MSDSPIIPMILAGGAGTRLWPLSREAAPKPFMPLPDGETLLGKTVARARPASHAPRDDHQPRLLLQRRR